MDYMNFMDSDSVSHGQSIENKKEKNSLKTIGPQTQLANSITDMISLDSMDNTAMPLQNNVNSSVLTHE